MEKVVNGQGSWVMDSESSAAKKSMKSTDQGRDRIDQELSRIPCGKRNIECIYKQLDSSLGLSKFQILEALKNELTPDVILTNETMDQRQVFTALCKII